MSVWQRIDFRQTQAVRRALRKLVACHDSDPIDLVLLGTLAGNQLGGDEAKIMLAFNGPKHAGSFELVKTCEYGATCFRNWGHRKVNQGTWIPFDYKITKDNITEAEREEVGMITAVESPILWQLQARMPHLVPRIAPYRMHYPTEGWTADELFEAAKRFELRQSLLETAREAMHGFQEELAGIPRDLKVELRPELARQLAACVAFTSRVHFAHFHHGALALEFMRYQRMAKGVAVAQGRTEVEYDDLIAPMRASFSRIMQDAHFLILWSLCQVENRDAWLPMRFILKAVNRRERYLRHAMEDLYDLGIVERRGLKMTASERGFQRLYWEVRLSDQSRRALELADPHGDLIRTVPPLAEEDPTPLVDRIPSTAVDIEDY